jgi:hypothetical protein
MKRKRGPLNASLVSKMKKKAEEGYKTGGEIKREGQKRAKVAAAVCFSLSRHRAQ